MSCLDRILMSCLDPECAVECSHNNEEAQREYEDKCQQHEGVQHRLELVEKQAQHAGEQELLLTEY